ncbi:MAG TPA: hypothetical protein VL094_05085 [Sphingomonadaceae bacterium]|nr:hypothetical protein [Sphingomonadaceae bacterium]
MKRLLAFTSMFVLAGFGSTAGANNVGENYAWQFQTTADKVNQAAILDLIEKKRSGYYAPPTYITNIDRQYNCNVAATATGNEGTNTNLANAPTTSGSTASSTGNNNSTDIDGWRSDNGADSNQGNSGSIGASVDGSTSASVSGSPTQALNSTQTNSGDQTATVNDSTACHFANVLN